MTKKEEIVGVENSLLEAIQNCNIEMLEELLHDDLLFILPNGQTITKVMDMDVYRSHNMAIESLVSRDQQINFIDDTAIVSVTIELKGKYFDHIIDGNFCYLRVWKLFTDKWKVIAGSGVSLD